MSSLRSHEGPPQGPDLCCDERDYRDILIDDLVQENMWLRSALREADARVTDLAVYREMTIAAFDALRSLTVRHQRLRDDYEQFKDRYRSMCEETLLRAGVDA